MKTGYAIALALAAFAAGAFLTTAVASGTTPMTGWSMEEMFQHCRSMMGQP